MSYPLCDSCLAAEELCSGCQKKLDSGEISDSDVKLSRFLNRLEGRFSMREVEIIKSHDIGSFLLVVAKGRISSLIGKNGRNIRLLAEHFGKRVRIVKHGDIRQMVQDLVFPARVYGINVVYSGKDEKYKVVVPELDRKKVIMDDSSLKKALELLFENEVTIQYN
jgi:transcription antitermination factor NusA-like protein